MGRAAHRRVDAVGDQAARTYVRENASPRRNSRGGRSAGENLTSALRCLYQRAGDDGVVPANFNPALKVDKPRRQASTRRALDGALVAEINHVAVTTGDDPELDTLILRLRTETACPVGGARSRKRSPPSSGV